MHGMDVDLEMRKVAGWIEIRRRVDQETERWITMCIDRGYTLRSLSIEKEHPNPSVTRIMNHDKALVTITAGMSPDAKRYVISATWSARDE